MFTSSRESFVLSDRSIRKAISDGSITVSPLPPDDAFQPASVEVTLADRLLLFNQVEEIDPSREMEGLTYAKRIHEQGFSLMPGEFCLGRTREIVTLDSTMAADFTGKSSLARLGLLVHVTAGYIDPGFSGTVTLEIANLNRNPIRLRAGMRIGQFKFFRLDTTCLRPYGHKELNSHYQGQEDVTPSRGWIQ